jgi:hypothetical protein
MRYATVGSRQPGAHFGQLHLVYAEDVNVCFGVSLVCANGDPGVGANSGYTAATV